MLLDFKKAIAMDYVNVNFYQQKGRRSIMVRFSWNNKQYRFSTGLYVELRYWNAEKMLPFINYAAYNQIKDKLHKIEVEIFKMLLAGLSVGKVKENVRYLAIGETRENLTMIGHGLSMVEMKMRQNICEKHVLHAVRLLEQYKAEKNIPAIKFEHINYHFKDEFIAWMISKEYSTNYIARTCRAIREIKMDVIKKQIIKDEGFSLLSWNLKTFKKDCFVLTWNILRRLSTIDLSDNDKLNEARYIFLVSCFTGCRVGDIANINKMKVLEYEGGKFLSFNTQKTDTPVIIPMVPEMEEIFYMYQGNFPTPGSKYNQRLKAVFKRIYQNKEITIRVGKANKVIHETVRKYTLVTSHTARRTFATLFSQMGVPIAIVSQVLGHSKISQTEKYINTEMLMRQQSSLEMLKVVSNSIKKVS